MIIRSIYLRSIQVGGKVLRGLGGLLFSQGPRRRGCEAPANQELGRKLG
jgi:hypothetical protein